MIAFLYHQQLCDGYPAGSPSFCLTVDHKMSIRRRKSQAFRNRLKPGWSSGAQAINKRWESILVGGKTIPKWVVYHGFSYILVIVYSNC